MRIARLERTSSKVASDFDPRKAVVYFDLVFQEGIANHDQAEIRDRDFPSLESKAVNNIGRMLKVRVSNEGHDSSGALICNFPLNSLEQAEELMETIAKNTEGGHDTIDTDVEYFVAQNFLFYPNGLRGDSYSIDGEGMSDGDLFDYLESQGVI